MIEKAESDTMCRIRRRSNGDAFDCSCYLDKPYWRRLNDKAFFDQVFVGYGTPVWPDEIDIGQEDVWKFTERYS